MKTSHFLEPSKQIVASYQRNKEEKSGRHVAFIYHLKIIDYIDWDFYKVNDPKG